MPGKVIEVKVEVGSKVSLHSVCLAVAKLTAPLSLRLTDADSVLCGDERWRRGSRCVSSPP